MSVQFESSRVKDRDRAALREARARVLDRARDRAEKEMDRKDREEQWMLPGLEDQIVGDKKSKKRHKKEKKKKRKKEKKKKKKKSKTSSSSSSSSDSEDQWVEKKDDGGKKDEAPTAVTSKRQDWMELGGGADLFGVRAATREEGRPRETDKQRKRREEEEENKRKLARLELNPDLRGDAGGSADATSSSSTSRPSHGLSDGGASWLRRAYKRAEERARAEGRSVEEVAAERWGSLDNFNLLLAKAEGRDPDERGGGGRSDRLREYKRDSRRAEMMVRKRSVSRERRRSRSRSRDRRRSRSRDRGERKRRRRRRSSSSSSSSSSSRSRSGSPRRRNKFARPGGDDGSRSRRSFARPGDDDRDREGDKSALASKFAPSSSGSWKTKDRREREKDEIRSRIAEREDERRRRSESPEPKRTEAVPEESQEKQAQEAAPAEKVLSDKELNVLGAKLVKAELIGNQALVDKLKAKLDRARAAKEESKARGDVEETSEEVVVLTRTDAKGLTRPVDAQGSDALRDKRNRRFKVETHQKGERVRYFVDDDRHDLKEMFEREKLSTAEDQNGMLARLAGKGVERTNDEYDLDDVFTSRAAKKGLSEEAEREKERQRAIAEHKATARTLEECRLCFGGPSFQKHLLVAVGRACFLSLPAHASLAEGHCVVAPMSHAAASTLLDEDVWAEMQEFRRALVRLFDAEDEDCVFFESCLNVRSAGRAPHLRLECVPVPRDSGEMAPMYFQKAIQECEGMWAQNQKLISLRDKSIRRAVPRELPYFHVDFGNQDGFAHVIEDEREFPRNFAQEIIGGMLDLEPRLWRNPKRDSFEAQKAKVLAFGAKWKTVDFTRKRRDRSSSSSDSD